MFKHFFQQREAYGEILRAIFSQGQSGALFDPSVSGTLFQDFSGTAADSYGDPVRLAYDVKNGVPVLGPELVTNGDFATATDPWTASPQGDGTAGIVSNKYQIDTATTGTNSYATYPALLTIGKLYYLEADLGIVSGGGAANVLNGAQALGVRSSVGTTSVSIYFIATNTALTLQTGTANGTVSTYDNISVKEIPGLHATAPSDAARPLYARMPRGGVTNRLAFLGVSSRDFTDGWTANGVTVTLNDTTAPDGTVTGTKMEAPNTSISKGVFKATTISAGDSDGVYAKKGNVNYLTLVSNTGVGDGWAIFNLDTGAVASSSGVTASMEDAGDGWYLCKAENYQQSGSYFIIGIQDDDPAANPWANGSVATGSYIYIWEAVYSDQSTLPTPQNVVASYDVTQSGVPDVPYLLFLGTQYMTIPGSADQTYMHDGTGGDAFGGFVVNKEDDGADDSLAASKNSGAEIGFALFQLDSAAYDSNAYYSISAGVSNILNVISSTGAIPRYTPAAIAFSYDVSADPDASVTVDGSVVLSGNDTGAPSSSDAANDITIMALPNGNNILPGGFSIFGFINGLTDTQRAQVNQYISNRIG